MPLDYLPILAKRRAPAPPRSSSSSSVWPRSSTWSRPRAEHPDRQEDAAHACLVSPRPLASGLTFAGPGTLDHDRPSPTPNILWFEADHSCPLFEDENVIYSAFADYFRGF